MSPAWKKMSIAVKYSWENRIVFHLQLSLVIQMFECMDFLGSERELHISPIRSLWEYTHCVKLLASPFTNIV